MDPVLVIALPAEPLHAAHARSAHTHTCAARFRKVCMASRREGLRLMREDQQCLIRRAAGRGGSGGGERVAWFEWSRRDEPQEGHSAARAVSGTARHPDASVPTTSPPFTPLTRYLLSEGSRTHTYRPPPLLRLVMMLRRMSDARGSILAVVRLALSLEV